MLSLMFTYSPVVSHHRLQNPSRPGPITGSWVFYVLLLCCLGCGSETPSEDRQAPTPADSDSASTADSQTSPWFVEVDASSGFDYVHFNGMSGKLYFNEMVGPGGALLDFDQDGDLDIFVVQGTMQPPEAGLETATFPPQHDPPFSDRLYRNDSGNGTWRFVDVTAESGLAAMALAEGTSRGYGMGVASGDVDNDGFLDLYVTRMGSNQLLHNQGDGTFRDITAAAGADDTRWSVSATFVDYDRDGWLDLFIGNYVEFTLASNKQCRAATGRADYCGPLSYASEPDRLLRNQGDGTFEEVTRRSGVHREFGGALGVVAADLDLDGWMDLYVANDGVANQMWMNQGDGTFSNEAVFSGSALNQQGHPEAGMGVDAGDVDNDGDEDLFLAHLSKETNTLYRNSGRGQFQDATLQAGLANPSWEATGFGTAFFDADNDSWLDILVLNGAVKVLEDLASQGDPYPLHQQNQIFRNLGDGRFEEITGVAGSVFAYSEVSRGAAFGDLDNDGDTDVLLANNNGPARLLENQASGDGVSGGNHWLGLQAVGVGGRDMLGAWLEIQRASGNSLWRRVATGGSYASARDPRVLVGLGSEQDVVAVRVRWPDGTEEGFPIDSVNRYHVLEQGQGTASP